MLMVGPPGSGKSMLAARLPGILPPLSAREMLEVSMIASIAGMLQATGMGRARAFRTPHHSASMAALVGRSEEHTSELQSLMRNSYAVFCLKKKKKTRTTDSNE